MPLPVSQEAGQQTRHPGHHLWRGQAEPFKDWHEAGYKGNSGPQLQCLQGLGVAGSGYEP